MSKEKVKLGAVSETMLITLWARAVESEKTNPILRDPKAAEILRQIDYNFAKFKISNQTQTACCVRDLIFDEQTRQFLAAHDDPVFVEIGAGLNTRFLRVDDGKVRWFDLDLPDSINLRRKFFAESERRQFISRSVLDPGWFAQVKAAGSKNVMFAAEGVLMYFTKSEVRELFKILAENFPNGQIIFDSISPMFVRFQRYYDALKNVDAEFQWGIRNIKDIEKWHHSIKVLETGGFGDLPERFYQYFPLRSRWLFKMPLFRNLYHINLIKIETTSLK
ncbi:MAG: class I SAM-dependent methyltransferase [Pyrinomonadaceae bacterium]